MASLNAPYGAPRFLATKSSPDTAIGRPGLNAPYGAPYFLTASQTGLSIEETTGAS